MNKLKKAIFKKDEQGFNQIEIFVFIFIIMLVIGFAGGIERMLILKGW